MSTVLITGGAGFIGSHLCEKLVETGYDVICIDNFNDSYSPYIKRSNLQKLIHHPSFRLAEGDILDQGLVDGILTKYQVTSIVHLAALAGVRRSIETPLAYIDVDIKGTVMMLEACKRHGIKKFVFASSSSVYGTGLPPFREDTPLAVQTSPYAAAKLSGELFCRTYNLLYGIGTVCLRFFTVYGPRQRPDMAVHIFAKAIDEGREISIYGDGSSSRDYTYVEDIVNGIIAAMNLECGFEAINLGNSKTVNIMRLAGVLEEKLGKKADIKFLPDQQGDVPSTCADLSKASGLLGYNPKVSIEEGIERFVEWYREQKNAGQASDTFIMTPAKEPAQDTNSPAMEPVKNTGGPAMKPAPDMGRPVTLQETDTYKPVIKRAEGINRPLKIIQVAPDIYPVPPENYGGIEAVVYEITEELVRRGHEVYLYAPEGSRTSAKLMAYRHSNKGDFGKIAEYVLDTMPRDADIIHDHTHISVLGKKNLYIPTVCTIHGIINYRVKYPVFVSMRALNTIGGNHGFFVYNGLNLDKYEYCTGKYDYMLYMGRLDKVKGLHHALDIAGRTKKRLIIAGPVHDTAFFNSEVEPRLKSNPGIKYIGSIGGKVKQEILKHAGCLLFPTSWEEPFGLVMIEAMACGTPVIALDNGAVPEVLKGFPECICHSVDEMAEKVRAGIYPPPDKLREYVLAHFTTEKMVEGYLDVYEKVLKEQKEILNQANPSTARQIDSGNLTSQTKRNITSAVQETVPEKGTPQVKSSGGKTIRPSLKRKTLRIVQVAPDAFPVPPKDYGGIERVIYDLTEELVRIGHEVYLYAAEGSSTSAKLIPYRHKGPDSKSVAQYIKATLPENIDLVHDHTHASVVDQLGFDIPVVSTIHDSRKNTAKYPVYLCKKALMNIGLNKGFYAYNGINTANYEFSGSKMDYLLFMGLLYSHKGVNYAIDVAERTGQNLIIAGPLYNLEYYTNEIEPRLKMNKNIKYVGTVGGQDRQNLLKNARCMLFPTVWEEPFGLVMIEAMACGTPVLAFGNGAVPEVLQGFSELICRDTDEMVQKVLNQAFPAPDLLREYVDKNFSVGIMAENYLKIYEKALR